MNLPITGDKLIELIPQKPPFVLISSIEKIEDNICETSFFIEKSHPMVENDKLTEGGLIENIAQSCAAKAGYEFALAGIKIPVGFIGDVRHFSCSKLPEVGSTISTIVQVENKVFGATIISGTVFQDGLPIASCKMKVFEEASDTNRSSE
jgi:predicted hotdog family 3-hydroxylacyl-ACP dehydratase